ncbi:hypothetical protein [Paracoccus albus]|uniref:hypothetical protein n=1 Tax=Paracoccus albus TaxID=3017784 RepID=UPI0022F015C2|nr:hypothetical protein [Paracoccus albus]WBU60168.1 hypothetical protein PAF20_15740 [Paracoccus albus]
MKLDRLITLRLRAVFAATVLAAVGLLAAIINSISHARSHSAGAGHSHELGQLFGLAPNDALTPIGIYRMQLDWLPNWLALIVGRWMHVEIWLFAVCCIPLLLVVFSIAFDWAIRGDVRDDVGRDEDYL